MSGEAVSIGPVEYIIVGFEGNNFNGRIVPELAALVESGQIRILDLVFISKDAEGDLVAFEYDELDEFAGLGDSTNDSMGLLNDEDIEMAAEVLEPNTSAAFLVFEDLWAAPFAAAVRDSGGMLIAGERIPHQIVVEAITQSLADSEI
jgi:hypothetical protein